MKHYAGNLNRMFRCLAQLAPELFGLVLAIAVLEAILPYVNVIAIQLMIDGLTAGRAGGVIVRIVVLTIAVNILFRLVLGELRRRREISEVRLDLAFQKKLHLHEMRLSLVELESAGVAELRRNIEQAKMRNGGVENVVLDFELVVKNLASLVTAGVVFARIFLGQQSGGSRSFWTSPFPVLILVLLVIAGTLLTLKWQAAQNIRVSELNEKANQANGSAFAYMEFISNYHFGKEIRIFSLGDYLCNFFEYLWTSSIGYTLTQELGKAKAKIPCITVLCNEILNVFIYILAIGKAYAKEISVGNVVVYINSIQAFVQAMVTLIGSSGEMMGHGVLMQPFLDLLDLEEECFTADEGVEVPAEIGELAFEHVYFKYPGQVNWVLEDVSFTLKGDQKMALVGENGAGKSTLIKLICRFYEPGRGCIKMNGVDIRRYEKTRYWELISAVFQDFSLPALALGNVISGKEDFDREKEEAVLRQVGMDAWMEKLGISFEQCLYNDFSDAGVEISGGESQKLAIARAVYKGAAVVILDEPTAALDPVAEAAVFRDFRGICEEKTCIFISHRLYSCRVCDFVVVLDKGRVVQQGRHEELVSSFGKYRELWEAQVGLYRDRK
ncbi:MAG: ABC transporter ATP-binding protein [Eubacteriales bacterium]|nr:ABC transporter ATP-binding protein [Eubacteriales bacterium]